MGLLTKPSGVDGEELVQLGRNGKQYALVAENSEEQTRCVTLLQRCLELCKEAPRAWPDDGEANDVKAFAERWMVVAQEMRSIPLDHGVGFVGGRCDKKYLIKFFCSRPSARGAKLLP